MTLCTRSAPSTKRVPTARPPGSNPTARCGPADAAPSAEVRLLLFKTGDIDSGYTQRGAYRGAVVTDCSVLNAVVGPFLDAKVLSVGVVVDRSPDALVRCGRAFRLANGLIDAIRPVSTR